MRPRARAPATSWSWLRKIVSKAEGRYVALGGVTAQARALESAAITGKDARLIELILGESSEVLRAKRDVLIVRHRLGFVMANAGIDRSNLYRSRRRRARAAPAAGPAALGPRTARRPR